MKFRKKPTIIEAEKFEGQDPEIEGIAFNYSMTDKSWQIYNRLHGNWINIKRGDYFRTDIPGDNYPIDAEYMKENYEEEVSVGKVFNDSLVIPKPKFQVGDKFREYSVILFREYSVIFEIENVFYDINAGMWVYGYWWGGTEFSTIREDELELVEEGK